MQGRNITAGREIYEIAETLLRTPTKTRVQQIAGFDQEQVDQFLDALHLMKENVKDIRDIGYSLLMKAITASHSNDCRTISYEGYTFESKYSRDLGDRSFEAGLNLGLGSPYYVVITPHLPTSLEITKVVLELKQQDRNLKKLAKPAAENDLEVKSVAPKKATLF